jgi:hypothetical protein
MTVLPPPDCNLNWLLVDHLGWQASGPADFCSWGSALKRLFVFGPRAADWFKPKEGSK